MTAGPQATARMDLAERGDGDEPAIGVEEERLGLIQFAQEAGEPLDQGIARGVVRSRSLSHIFI